MGILDANIVSGRARHHFDPSVNYASIDDGERIDEGGSSPIENGPSIIEKFRALYRPTHESMQNKMLYAPISRLCLLVC